MLKSLDTVIRQRRATPHFKPDPVPPELLEKILDLALQAPSGYNLQPWRFIVVRDPQNRKKLRAAAMDQPKVEEAPVVIIACGDTRGWASGDLDRMIELGRRHGTVASQQQEEKMRSNISAFLGQGINPTVWVTRQTMIAFTHIMLLAEAHGLDTAPMEGFWEDRVRAAFNIPEELNVVALLALGYAASDKPFGGRFEKSHTVRREDYRQPW